MVLTDNIKTILSRMDINDTKQTTTLTGTLSRSDYVEINEVLETMGGVWNRKAKCHVWNCKPSEKLNVILSPSTKTVTTNIETKKERKKVNQAFYTPAELADRLVEIAQIQDTDTILEPSAGIGNICKAIHRDNPNVKIDAYEIDSNSVTELKSLDYVNVIGSYFLECSTGKKYD